VTDAPNGVRRLFVGPGGIRAGWRLAMFVAIVVLIRWVVRLVAGEPFRIATLEPRIVLVSRTISFAIFAAAAGIMAKIEKQPFGGYGLPPRRAFSFDALVGILWGFGSLSLVMLGLYATRCYRIEGFALHGGDIPKFGASWLAAFVVLALFEEFSLRGYPQRTLASGIGFWPAATLLSLLFVAGHLTNPGETAMGLTGVFMVGMFYSFVLLLTGDLWCAVAMHASWDWGLSYFYSVADSAMPAAGHLFDARLEGPAWLSGGTAGPEGSVVCAVVQLLSFPAFFFYARRRFRRTEPDARVAAA
jgi:membrane protease YdiL (CAAX protease family)